jgi:hypothetical protein
MEKVMHGTSEGGYYRHSAEILRLRSSPDRRVLLLHRDKCGQAADVRVSTPRAAPA